MSKHTNPVAKYLQVSKPVNAAIVVLFILLALLCVVPAVFVLIISLSSENAIRLNGYQFIPAEWSLDAYAWLWKSRDYIGRSFLNSIGITLVGTVSGLFMCSTMAYGLSRRNYRLRGFFTVYIFIPMLFSGGLVSSYMINSQIFKLSNTYWALILPAIASSWYIVIMRTFFQTTVPDAVVESAKIDGARQIRIFAQIVLPISLPALATIGLFFAFAFWNDWFLAKMYLDTNRKDLYPLQYLLMSIETNIDFLQSNKDFMTAGTQAMIPSETIRMAIVMVLVVPIACTYPFFQRYFISGLTIGAVKG
ncbi:MAG: carbohydrate ABC transporter permease [Christensenellales bacterium]|jgi:putative aldouronate transport system permease protein